MNHLTKPLQIDKNNEQVWLSYQTTQAKIQQLLNKRQTLFIEACNLDQTTELGKCLALQKLIAARTITETVKQLNPDYVD